MCFNAEISISTFLLGIVSISIGIINNVINPYFAFFYLSVVLMQLIEYFLWIYLNDSYLNNILSLLGYILLNIQIIILVSLIYPYNKLLFYFLFLIILIYFIYKYIFIKHWEFKTIKNKNSNRLEWKFLHSNIFTMFMIFFIYVGFQSFILLFIYNYEKNKYFKFLILIFIALNIIAIFYSLYNYFNSNTFGSTYCIFLNIFSFFIIFVSLYKNYVILN